jgi:uncharacterized glyoxalase superfamily protein PhnB
MRIAALIPSLTVAEVGRSLRYYRQLGFEAETTLESGGATVWAKLRNGELRLMLSRADRRPAAARAARPDDDGIVLHLYVASAHEAHAALELAGLQPTAVERKAHGVETFRLRDPDGHAIVVTSAAVQIA